MNQNAIESDNTKRDNYSPCETAKSNVFPFKFLHGTGLKQQFFCLHCRLCFLLAGSIFNSKVPIFCLKHVQTIEWYNDKLVETKKFALN